MRQAKLARKARFLRWAMNFYPPYLGAGVRIQHIAGDFREVRVKMGLGWYNRNYVGTQFGLQLVIFGERIPAGAGGEEKVAVLVKSDIGPFAIDLQQVAYVPNELNAI